MDPEDECLYRLGFLEGLTERATLPGEQVAALRSDLERMEARLWWGCTDGARQVKRGRLAAHRHPVVIAGRGDPASPCYEVSLPLSPATDLQPAVEWGLGTAYPRTGGFYAIRWGAPLEEGRYTLGGALAALIEKGPGIR